MDPKIPIPPTSIISNFFSISLFPYFFPQTILKQIPDYSGPLFCFVFAWGNSLFNNTLGRNIFVMLLAFSQGTARKQSCVISTSTPTRCPQKLHAQTLAGSGKVQIALWRETACFNPSSLLVCKLVEQNVWFDVLLQLAKR